MATELHKGEIIGLFGEQNKKIDTFTAHSTITAGDVVQLTTSNTVQMAAANATQLYGFAKSSAVDGGSVEVVWGRSAAVVMGITGTASSIKLGEYYALAGTTGAQTFDQSDTGNDALTTIAIDTTNSLVAVAIITAALQPTGVVTTATEA